MGDILSSLKGNKFALIDGHYNDTGKELAILTDIEYWNNNFSELQEWCRNNGADITGMTVEFPSHKEVLLFVLRWA